MLFAKTIERLLACIPERITNRGRVQALTGQLCAALDVQASLLNRIGELESISKERSAYLQELESAVCKLRVQEGSLHGRTGFEVAIFIPNETIDKLRAEPDRRAPFVERFARKLVMRAIHGCIHVRSGDKPCALVFMPLSPNSPKREILAFTDRKCLNL